MHHYLILFANINTCCSVRMSHYSFMLGCSKFSLEKNEQIKFTELQPSLLFHFSDPVQSRDNLKSPTLIFLTKIFIFTDLIWYRFTQCGSNSLHYKARHAWQLACYPTPFGFYTEINIRVLDVEFIKLALLPTCQKMNTIHCKFRNSFLDTSEI